MTPIAQQTLRVILGFDMMHLRTQASIAQHWRRRLAGDGPQAWIEFKSMYGGEIDAERRRLAARIRKHRRAGGLP